MKSNTHQSKTFDSLRAGLRVEGVDFQDAGTPRLMDRENAYWRQIVDTLEEDVNRDRATCNRLRILRRQVLNGERRREARWGLPHVVAGAAAGVAVFLGAAMWWEETARQPVTATRTASATWDAAGSRASPDARAVSIEPMDTESMEFADNIDFYTWLEKQSDTVADSGGG